MVDGVTYSEDIKIVGGRVVSDWWRASGHKVDVDDVADIFAQTPEVLVIGRGQPGYLDVTEKLRSRLQERGITLIAQATPQAVETYNRLAAEGKAVCAGIHVGC